MVGRRFGFSLQIQQRCFKGGGGQCLQIAAADFRIGVLGRDHFALLGNADLPGNSAVRLRQDGQVARPAATPDRAATAMEQAQTHARRVENACELDLGFVQLPAGGEKTAVLVAVRVPEHHFLLVAARTDQRAVGGQREEALHDRRAVAQIADRFEQRDDVHAQLGRLAGAKGRRRLQQAGFLEQQGDFEQIRHAVGLGNDRVGQGRLAVSRPQFPRGKEDLQFAERLFAVVQVRRIQRARIGDLFGKQGNTRFLIQRGVTRLGRDAAGADQQFADRALVDIGVLAQVNGCQMESEDLHGAHQALQTAAGDQRGALRR